jgi:hypothetical protein
MAVPVRDAGATSSVRRVIDSLVIERQRLRRDNAGSALLDANRIALRYWQEQLAKLAVADARD